ncbi:hypothetical protein V9K67_15100 [Paraflavisolibacter sp. H34]|uniref:hypothetical protein n=1 Tax=Huijunlia imazamoxiresistens TaxID=3127457 RepID=UPI0030160EDA
MKAWQLLLLLCFWIHGSCFSQDSAVKLYAYRQGVSSGVRPAIPEEGSAQEAPASGKEAANYFIYLAHPAGVKVYPVALWIEGEPFGIKWESVAQKPVELATGDEGEKKVLLVPATAEAVLQLHPVDYIPGKEARPAAALLQANQLVVVYRQGGKMHTRAVKTFQSLSRASLP